MQILYDAHQLVAVNKPPGLNVHEAPGAGSSVLRELRDAHGLSGLTPVHRLDKDASGVLLLARTKEAASAVQKNWASAEKTYFALCEGAPAAASGTIDAPILEHQTGKPERLENAVRYFKKSNPGATLPPLPPPKTSAVHPAGREAQTTYRVLEQFTVTGKKWCWLEVSPHQGRMHQIRVHLAHAGTPLAVDPLYGKRKELRRSEISSTASDEIVLSRLPLHAAKLTFTAPNGERVKIEAPTADDLVSALKLLQA